MWHHSNAVGWVKLQVASEDIFAAETILASNETIDDGGNDDGANGERRFNRCRDCDLMLNAELSECPACGCAMSNCGEVSADAHKSTPTGSDDALALDRARHHSTPLSGLNRIARRFFGLWVGCAVLMLGFGFTGMVVSVVNDVSRPAATLLREYGPMLLFVVAALAVAAIWRQGRGADADDAR